MNETKNGVQQCSILSPTFFNIIMSEICLEIKQEKNNTKILVYADDVMLWANNVKELEKNLNRLNNIGNKFGIKINLEKSVIQKITRNPYVSCINLKGRQLKDINTF